MAPAPDPLDLRVDIATASLDDIARFDAEMREEAASANLGFEEDEACIRRKLDDLGVRGGLDGLQSMTVARRKATLPILVDCLRSVRSRRARGMLVRAMRGRWASSAARDLLMAFVEIEDPHVRWAIGEAVDTMVGPNFELDVVEDLRAILQQRRYGRSREMLAHAFARIPDDEARSAAVALLGQDPQLDGHLVSGLDKAKCALPRDVLVPWLGDPRSWVKRPAHRIAERGQNNIAP